MMARFMLLTGSLLVTTLSVQAGEYALTEGSDIVGSVEMIEAKHEDTFVLLARRYNVGFEALKRANPDVDAWLPGEGTRVAIPKQHVLPRAPRRGIVINLPELRLYYFPDGESGRVITHPISIGRMEWGTPLGATTVVAKAVNPAWYPPQSIRDEHAAQGDPLPSVVPPGPDNPLGSFALRLGLPGYLIHGTNRPAGVGMRVTHGCIRMFPEDIEALFSMVDAGTPVRIVNQPFKLGWGPEGLFMEAHPPLEEVDEDTDEQWTATELTRLYVAATEERQVQVRWRDAELVMKEAQGIPAFVSVAGTIVEAPADAPAEEATAEDTEGESAAGSAVGETLAAEFSDSHAR